jgi:hypothetical protein
MSPGEETRFQQHLEECNVCRAYVNSIRRLSCLIADEELVYAKTPLRKRPVREKTRLWSFVSIAACVLLVGGLSIYIFNDGGPGVLNHKTSVNRQAVADKEEMEVGMIFPDKEEVTVGEGDSLVFRWNREASYKLILRSGEQIVAEAKGEGGNYAPEADKIKGIHVLNWALTLDGKKFKGKIYFNNK